MKYAFTPTHRLALLTLGVLLNLLWLGAPAATAQKIPDANFAQAIRDVCPTCIDAENNLLAPAKTLSSLNVDNKSIASIEGIIGFTELKYIGCNDNALTALPSMPGKLEYWAFGNNQLSILPELPSNLITLYVNRNNLNTLPNLPAGLKTLQFSGNKITNLPLLPAGLTYLESGNNPLGSLPILPVNLEILGCYNNGLNSLPSLPNSLKRLSCFSNKLTALPELPMGLTELKCYDNNALTSLPTLPNTLKNLSIDINKITCLPNAIEGLKVYNKFANDPIPTPPVCSTTPDPTPTPTSCLPLDDKCSGNIAETVTQTIATNIAGSKKLVLSYRASEGEFTLQVVINGKSRNVILPQTPSDRSFQSMSIGTYAMSSGNNNFILSSSSGYACFRQLCVSEAEEICTTPVITISASPSTTSGSPIKVSVVGCPNFVVWGSSGGPPSSVTANSATYSALGTYTVQAICRVEDCEGRSNILTLTIGNATTPTPDPDPTPAPANCLALGDQCSGNASEVKTFTLNQAAAGSKILKLIYRASEGEAKLRLTINGNLSIVTLPQTAGGGAYGTAELGNFTLNAGNNTITMATGGGYLCFRQLCTEGAGTTPTPDPTPAPANCLALGDQCSGNAFEVKTFTLSQAAAGSKMLKLTYRASEGEARLRLTINGNLSIVTLPQTAGGGAYGTAELGSFALNAGNNTVTMATGGGYLCFRQLCAEGGSTTPPPTSAACLALGDQCSGNASEVKTYALTQATAGNRMLKLTYRAVEGQATLRLTINGALRTLTLPRTPGDGSYATAEIGTFALNAGNNTITMATGGGYLCFRQLCTEGSGNAATRLSAEETTAQAAPLTAYPNPTTGSFEASFYLAPGQRAALTVSDLLGRPVWTKALTGQGEHREQVRLPEAASGVLILRLQRENARPGQAAEFTKVLVVK